MKACSIYTWKVTDLLLLFHLFSIIKNSIPCSSPSVPMLIFFDGSTEKLTDWKFDMNISSMFFCIYSLISQYMALSEQCSAISSELDSGEKWAEVGGQEERGRTGRCETKRYQFRMIVRCGLILSRRCKTLNVDDCFAKPCLG